MYEIQRNALDKGTEQKQAHHTKVCLEWGFEHNWRRLRVKTECARASHIMKCYSSPINKVIPEPGWVATYKVRNSSQEVTLTALNYVFMNT